MVILRYKQIKAMSEEEAHKKVQDLRLESIKELKPGQGASIKTKEIKRTIARLLTYIHTKKEKPLSKKRNI